MNVKLEKAITDEVTFLDGILAEHDRTGEYLPSFVAEAHARRAALLEAFEEAKAEERRKFGVRR